MIYEFVFYSRHHHAIKKQHVTEFFGLYHGQILKIRFLCNIGLLNLRGDPEYRGLFLRKPQFHNLYLLSVKLMISHTRPSAVHYNRFAQARPAFGAISRYHCWPAGKVRGSLHYID
ncbi:hypothetical protein D3C76_1280880 [compost metagenome]